ncbi:uncharacterized protein LOC130782197 [Actinidia eriantha]|uniref:uncharacterized protein LOC130782197 n=1 Tax=Actinidia eriantha TaxID=165200 RepID=UPI00258C78E5|nr:uncharacterized protein LOC130782197 [Actinidia eriantha]
MEEERQRDCRVPLISTLFFFSCLIGGVLLVLWLLDSNISQPWFPILALALIGFPWGFWFLTYIYTLIKPCFQRGGGGRELSHRPKPLAAVTAATSPRDFSVTSPTGKRQVHFGAAMVMGSDGSGRQSSRHDGGEELSIASSKECEMPLTLAVSS